MEQIETVVVGAGQAGLAVSYCLQRRGREHLVLERASYPAPVWRDERWDSFALVTPNATLRLPGAAYHGPDPDGFLTRDETVAFFHQYADLFDLPIQYRAQVRSIEPTLDAGFQVAAHDRVFQARNVVVATGYEQLPHVPDIAASLLPSIAQMHSSQYRNPEALPDGAVLVVGSGQSGAQIADDLHGAGRTVFLATSGAGRVPRRYRGKDIVTWLMEMRFCDMTPESLPVPIERFAAPHVSGREGGRTLNLHQFARDGITLLGHVRGISGSVMTIAPDLHENVQRADDFEVDVLAMIDAYIARHGINAAERAVPALRDGFAQPIMSSLDLDGAGIGSVIWATGYRYDYRIVRAAVFDSKGFPVQVRGATRMPGLYFVGMPWMPSLKTGSLIGIADAAECVAAQIDGVVERRAQREFQTVA